MSYCREHSTMNCVVCALREQTQVLVLELRAIAKMLESKNKNTDDITVDRTIVPLRITPVRDSYWGAVTVTAPLRCPARRKPTLWERLMYWTSEQELRCTHYDGHQAKGSHYHRSADGKRWVD